jgi:outer membrane biosynthesis protein TonB
MQNTGQGSEKRSYPVILLLVVGLAAFSSAMKELNQVRDLTLEASNLVAQWKDAIAPADPMLTVSVETCQNSRTLLPPPPPLPALPPLPPAAPVQSGAVDVVVPEAPPAPEVAPPAPPAVREVPKPRRVSRPAHDAAEVRMLLSNDDFVEKSLKDAFESDQSFKAFKTKNRRFIFITPEGHDVILKTLNRSVNLRSAS